MPKRTVALLPDQITFEVEENEIILDAAIRQNIALTYTCRNGTCRTCLTQVHEGIVRQLEPELCLISPEELAAGRRLICMCIMESDIIIEKIVRRRRKEAVEEIALMERE